MKKNLLYVLLLLVLLMSACAPAAATEVPAEPAAGGEITERCGDKSKLAEKIYLYTWVEYIDPAIKDSFTSIRMKRFLPRCRLAAPTMTLSSPLTTWCRS
jgi:spermidine/putrescine-binding protein